jgi:hypothetical protein
MVVGSLHASARRLSRGLLAALLTAGLSGCGEPRRGPFDAAAHPASIAVEVRNNNFLDVVVYALPDGRRIRLGTVTGKCDAALQLPSAYAAPRGFRLEADPVGSLDTYVTDVIYADVGTVVVLEVGSALGMSSWHLR